ncbi:MAG: hypothetical protein GX900_02930 [Clostridiaceae bacterium]|nr:hypothetical protein [Clostridiaceae bacterium]
MRIVYSPKRHDLIDGAIREVVDSQRKWPRPEALVLVPDIRTLAVEARSLELMPGGSMLFARVLSFRRLAAQIFSGCGGNSARILNIMEQRVLLRALISELHTDGKLRLLGNMIRKSGYTEEILHIIGDFNRYGLSTEHLTQVAADLTPESILERKLADLAIILPTWNATLCEKELLDTAGLFDWLISKLTSWRSHEPTSALERRYYFQLKESTVWIAGFGEDRLFTPQEFKLIELLESLTDSVTLTLPTGVISPDNTAENYINPGDYFAWRTALSFYDSPISFKLESLELTAKEIPDDAGSAVDRGEEYYFVPTPNLRAQTEWLAGEIRRLVFEQNFRYRDIAVAVDGNIDLLTALSDSLAMSRIPAFFQSASLLTNLVLGRFIADCLQLRSRGMRRLNLRPLLYSPLLGIDRQTADLIDNIWLAEGNEGEKLFTLERATGVSEDILPILRAELTEKLYPLVSQIAGWPVKADCRAWAHEILSLLREFDIEEKLRALMNKEQTKGNVTAAAGYSRSWKQMNLLLRLFVEVSPEMVCDLAEMKEIFAEALLNLEAELIPAHLDEVFVGNLQQVSTQRYRAVFLLSVNDENFPISVNDTAFLRDEEKTFLREQTGVDLPIDSENIYYLAATNIRGLEQACSEKLYLLTDQPEISPPAMIGAESIASQKPVVLPLSELPTTRSDVRCLAPMWQHLLRRSVTDNPNQQVWRELERGGARLRTPKTASGRISAQLLRIPRTLSVSRLERYNSCPYNYFLAQILGLEIRPVYELGYDLTGSLIHEVLDRAVSDLIDKIREHSPSDVELVLSAWLPENPRELSAFIDAYITAAADDEPRYAIFFDRDAAGDGRRRIRHLLMATFPQLRQQWGNASRIKSWPNTEKASWNTLLFDESPERTQSKLHFLPLASEWSFGRRDSSVKPFPILMPDGREILLTGVIDRIDAAYENDRLIGYRLIDYKTGNKRISYPALYRAVDLQLPIYSMVTNQSFLEPVMDMAYLQVERHIVKLNRPATPEDEAQQLESHGTLSSLKQSTETISRLETHTLRQVVNTFRRISTGEYAPLPRVFANQAPCTFCEYRSICPVNEPLREGIVVSARTEDDQQISAKNFAGLLADQSESEEEGGEV